MSLSIQLQSMLAMIGMGGWLGISIDTYGRLIRGRRWGRWITFVNDSLFWIVQGLAVFLVLLEVNEGEMRFYLLLALLCGYSCYRALLYRVYFKILEAVIQGMIALYKFVKAAVTILLINPTKVLLKVLYKLCMMIISFLTAVLFFLAKGIYVPFLWIGRGIWHIMPKDFFKKKLGFFVKVKNYFSKWFRRKQ